MKITLAALLCAAFIGGCASGGASTAPDGGQSAAVGADGAAASPPQEASAGTLIATQKVQVRKSSNVVCTRETMIGSHRKRRVCRTIAQQNEEREEAQEVFRKIQRHGIN